MTHAPSNSSGGDSAARRPTLFYAKRSSALASRLALEEAGADYVLRVIDLAAGEQRSAAYLRINPAGRVPALQEGAFILTENVAILTYIARRHPEARLWPDTPRDEARCLEWLAWGASILHPALAHMRRPERYASNPLARDDIVATARTMLSKLFEIVERRLEGAAWAVGGRMSVADLYLLFFWIWGPGPASGADASSAFPTWTNLARRLALRPRIRAILQDEGLAST